MQKMLFPAVVAALVLSLHPSAALAYIGPGVGAGAIAAVLGVLGSILLAIVAVIYYPIKRMMKNRKVMPKDRKVNNAKAAPVDSWEVTLGARLRKGKNDAAAPVEKTSK